MNIISNPGSCEFSFDIIGTPEAYALIKNDQETASRTYNMARYIYTLFAIEQGDYDEADFTMRRKLGRHEFIADIYHLRFYLYFKQGTVHRFTKSVSVKIFILDFYLNSFHFTLLKILSTQHD